MILSGKILYDNEAAPFAGVYISDSKGNYTEKAGAKSDVFGNYSLNISSASPNDFITYAHVGSKKTVAVAALNCTKTPCTNSVTLSGSELPEVVVKPTETPSTPAKKCSKKCKLIIGSSIALLLIAATVIYFKTKTK
jgi:hypothetical protein